MFRVREERVWGGRLFEFAVAVASIDDDAGFFPGLDEVVAGVAAGELEDEVVEIAEALTRAPMPAYPARRAASILFKIVFKSTLFRRVPALEELKILTADDTDFHG